MKQQKTFENGARITVFPVNENGYHIGWKFVKDGVFSKFLYETDELAWEDAHYLYDEEE